MICAINKTFDRYSLLFFVVLCKFCFELILYFAYHLKSYHMLHLHVYNLACQRLDEIHIAWCMVVSTVYLLL